MLGTKTQYQQKLIFEKRACDCLGRVGWVREQINKNLKTEHSTQKMEADITTV